MDFRKWKPTRRQLIKAGLISGAGMMVPWKFKLPKAFAQIDGGTLDPTLVPKYQMPLVKPPVLPRDGKILNKMGKNADYYEIYVNAVMGNLRGYWEF